jgi:hypothetical protein
MLIKKNLVYLGIDNPNSAEQVKVEICGLKYAINFAEELISRLEQSLAIADLNAKEIIHDGGTQKESGSTETEPKTQNRNEKVSAKAKKGNKKRARVFRKM